MASPQRPDLAVMQATLPAPAGPSSVDMQAAAQAPDARPHIDYAGTRWYLTRVPDMFDLGELGEAIEQAEDNPITALGGINRCLRATVADYPGLRAAFRTNGGDLDAYVLIATRLFEASTARPTGPAADSSDGPRSTSTSSKDDSPSPAASMPVSAPFTHG